MKPETRPFAVAATEKSAAINRRSFLTSAATAVTAAALAPAARATERDWTGKIPTRYPDPDILSLDKRFTAKIGNTPIQRLYHSDKMLWAEGCAWNAVGRYLLWSDIPNNVQMRWIEDDGHVSTFRNPAGNSNGNTFDYEGRELSCEHGNRRVVRYEHNGGFTVLADKFGGKPFNAPNDIVVHPDGGIWFTDPGYGSLGYYEGNKGELVIKEAVYRIDGKTGKIEKVLDDMFKPNGICFSPDYKKLYVADTGASHYPEAPKNIRVYDVDGTKVKNGREFCSMKLTMNVKVETGAARALPEFKSNQAATDQMRKQAGWENALKDDTNRVAFEYAGFADGIRADVDGNIWVGAGWVGAGYDGVHIFAPDGVRIGQILLPEICANICFGGPKRNRLFMAASTSLYAVYVETQGAHIT